MENVSAWVRQRKKNAATSSPASGTSGTHGQPVQQRVEEASSSEAELVAATWAAMVLRRSRSHAMLLQPARCALDGADGVRVKMVRRRESADAAKAPAVTR